MFAPTLKAASAWILVAGLLAGVSGTASAGRRAQAPLFRGRVDLVNLGVTVSDRKGSLITGLGKEDFQILEDGREQTIRYFANGEVETAGDDPQLHLGVLLDVSGSMADDIAFMRTASIRFLNTFLDAVDITLVDFDTEIRVARFGQPDFARLVERIRRQKLGTYTAMYDAIGVYLDGAADQNGRKVMLLYTDGGDTRSSLGFGDLLNLLKASDVTVYAIGSFDRRRGASNFTEQRRILQQVADTTGGQVYFPSSAKELDKVYRQIESEIRAQYTLGYVSANEKLDGAWRKVEIRMKDGGSKDLRIRSRKGYFAPFKPSR
jgi:Ca-activated chloride channel homolog